RMKCITPHPHARGYLHTLAPIGKHRLCTAHTQSGLPDPELSMRTFLPRSVRVSNRSIPRIPLTPALSLVAYRIVHTCICNNRDQCRNVNMAVDTIEANARSGIAPIRRSLGDCSPGIGEDLGEEALIARSVDHENDVAERHPVEQLFDLEYAA